ncbi:MAG: MBL fold metallo-hydrolase [Candidatus Heimdallarchaeaceae archaeon]
MKHMEIIPLACESLGTRSFSHLVITDDTKILFDPSVSLAPRRFRLNPHPLEIAASWISRKTILKAVSLSEIVIQTHYHADHFTLPEFRIYEFTNKNVFEETYSEEKIIYAKDPENNINYNQKRRAKYLWRNKKRKLFKAEGNIFQIGNTKIKFSEAVSHNIDERLGFVFETIVDDGKRKYLYTSDVSGPVSEKATDFIVNEEPDILVLDGPTYYHPRVSKKEKEIAFQNLKIIKDSANKIYIDHHFLRKKNWKEKLEKEVGVKFPAFSQIIGLEPIILEAMRKELFKETEVKEEFYSLLEKGLINTDFFLKILKENKIAYYWKKINEKIEKYH